jgi:bifunctional DNase/RNase
MVEVRLTAVRVDLQSNTPVVLLQEAEGARSLPIFIGAPEATAIAYALQHFEVPRPLTHDLLKDLIEALGASVVRVVVTDLRERTYFAEIHLRIEDREISVSSRPSDAIAVALRSDAPLFVEDELMQEAGVVIALEDEDSEEEGNSEELVGEFREFLSNVRPEDFAP